MGCGIGDPPAFGLNPAQSTSVLSVTSQPSSRVQQSRKCSCPRNPSPSKQVNLGRHAIRQLPLSERRQRVSESDQRHPLLDFLVDAARRDSHFGTSKTVGIPCIMITLLYVSWLKLPTWTPLKLAYPPKPTASHSCPVRIMVPTPLRPDPSRTSITQTHGMSGPCLAADRGQASGSGLTLVPQILDPTTTTTNFSRTLTGLLTTVSWAITRGQTSAGFSKSWARVALQPEWDPDVAQPRVRDRLARWRCASRATGAHHPALGCRSDAGASASVIAI